MRTFPAEVLAEAARAAGLAPSVHNTQPWRWRIHGDQLDLYADRSRQLEAAPAAGRPRPPYLVLRLGLADPDHPGPPHTPRLPPTQTVEIVE